MPRRTTNNPLARSGLPRWLVTYDMHRGPVEVVELAPATDLARALSDAMQAYIDQGWKIEATETRRGFFFMNRSGVRMEVGIQQVKPPASLVESSAPHSIAK